MDAPRTRKRRIARAAALVVVVPLLLIAGYVSSWLTFSRAAGEGLISGRTAERIRPVFNPIFLYLQADLPGGGQLYALWWKLNPIGLSQHHSITRQTLYSYIVTDAIHLAPVDSRGAIIPVRPEIPEGGALKLLE